MLVIFGAGGHGRAIASIASHIGYNNITFCDDLLASESIHGLAVLSESELLRKRQSAEVVIAVGDNFRRRLIQEKIITEFPFLEFTPLVDPRSVIMSNVSIGIGTVVSPTAFIGDGVSIGEHCFIGPQCAIEHGSAIGDFNFCGIGSKIAGDVRTEERVSLLAACTVLQGISIGADSIIGGSALVNHDVPPSVVAYGVPAKIARSRASDEPSFKNA